MASGLSTIHAGSSGEALKEGLQSFVSQTSKLTATTVAGTPAAGVFYSTITGRTPIVDISKDLKVSMGIERIMTQQAIALQNEFGPNGEQVYSVLNDDRGLIRFVGTWGSTTGSQGSSVGNGSSGDLIEITFYGTGLNILTLIDSTNRNFTYKVDGGTAVSGSYPATGTGLLVSRGYAQNQVLNVVSGLALGTHTVQIIASANQLFVDGFEVISSISTLSATPGTAYIDAQKVTLSAAQTPAYNTGFESGTLGTRGGRVLAYLKQDGTIGKAVQPSLAQANLTAADHTNEELVRTHHWREFGAGRTDDFSSVASGGAFSARTFVLDDGTTTLACSSLALGTINGFSFCAANAGDFLTITFVGTGLDIIRGDDRTGAAANSTSVAVTVDGVSIGNLLNTTSSLIQRREKIVSGLPYGTHVVKLTAPSATNSYNPVFIGLVVYQPKKPTLPTSAIELADYNVMADYSLNNTTAVAGSTSAGVLRKLATREFVYSGTWSAQGIDPNFLCGQNLVSNTSGSFFELTFFGTGFNHKLFLSASPYNFSYQVDGSSNLSAFTGAIAQTGTGLSYTSSTGVVSGTVSGGSPGYNGATFSLTGLPLGVHKVRFTLNTAINTYADAIDIITPIHSAKSNLYGDLQNTLLVGSQGISDNRKTTIVKDAFPVQKAWAQAVGVTANPTTTSAAYVPVPDMSLSIKTTGSPIELFYSILENNSGVGTGAFFQFYVDGLPVGTERFYQGSTGGYSSTLSDSFILPVSAGVHKVDLYWKVNGNTSTASENRRVLKAREI